MSNIFFLNVQIILVMNLGTCGTEEEGFWLSQVLVDFVGNRNLSVCK